MILWFLIVQTSAVSPKKARCFALLLEAFLHFGAKADFKFRWIQVEVPDGEMFMFTKSNKPDWCIVECTDTIPLAKLAVAQGGVLTLRDLIPLWFPKHKIRLQALVDGNIAGKKDSSGYWERMLEMPEEELGEELDGIEPLFPDTKAMRERSRSWPSDFKQVARRKLRRLNAERRKQRQRLGIPPG
jgi:hypothetical protein